MSPAKLLKSAPIAVLLAFLGYSVFTLQAAIPGAAEKEAELAKGLEQMLHDLVAAHAVAGGAPVPTRDPFVPVARPEEAAEAAAREAASPASDPLAEVVAGLSLDATFIQGRDQLAVINGRLYQRGQTLVLPGDDHDPRPPLSLLYVRPTGVILRGGDKNYALGYPEHLGRKPDPAAGAAANRDDAAAELDLAGQAAMFQRLLNSPLGALGRSLIGEAASPRRTAGPRAASRPGAGRTTPAGSPGP
jgi:hypothetical protein